MRMAYIDLGAYNGDTVKQFLMWGQLITDPRDFEIHAFEPNPNMAKQLTDLADQYPNVTFHNEAAWIEDTELEFAVDTTDSPLGSTLMKGKAAIWDNFNHVTVKAFDFSKWLKDNFHEHDLVIVKMDIEGAEFPVLEKMIKDGTITIPEHLCVEFHPNKVREYTTDHKNDLIERCKKQGMNILEWH